MVTSGRRLVRAEEDVRKEVLEEGSETFVDAPKGVKITCCTE